jgi:molybdopterin synthase sulfur carrier subunit
MNIRLRYFASIREALGTAQETVSVPDDVRTLGQLRRMLQQRGGVWADTLAEGRALKMACNQQMADSATEITGDCEVAFFPPVTGG